MISKRRSAFRMFSSLPMLLPRCCQQASGRYVSSGSQRQAGQQKGELTMIMLSGTGANFGLPEASPYVTKTEVHLRMAGLAYDKRRANPSEGPKGQVPFIDDGGRLIGDS